MVFPDLSKIQAIVHTSWGRIIEKAWNLLRIIVTLHQQNKNSVTIKGTGH